MAADRTTVIALVTIAAVCALVLFAFNGAVR